MLERTASRAARCGATYRSMDSTRLMQPFAESRRTMTRFGLEEHLAR